jgi:hypothetical protein
VPLIRRLRGTIALLPVLAAMLTGCGGGQDQAVTVAADHFVSAVGAGNGAAACALLSPDARSELDQSQGKPCEKAIVEEDVKAGSVERVSVFETAAQVKFSDEVVFLSRFDSGWLVTAAACTAVPGQPYDCDIQGG